MANGQTPQPVAEPAAEEPGEQADQEQRDQGADDPVHERDLQPSCCR
jgi:hypothetical protein